MKDFFTVDERTFAVVNLNAYQCTFRDFRIRVFMASEGIWHSVMETKSATHWNRRARQTPLDAARSALTYWKDEIEESDRLDAEDSDRERREYERSNKLRRSDVL